MPLLILAEIGWATSGPTSALETAGRAEHLASQRGLGEMEIASRTTRLGPLFDLGRWDELLALAGDVIEWSIGTGGTYEIVSARPWAAQVLLLRGRLEEASAAVAHFMKRAREVGDPQVLVPAAVAAGWVALAEGRTEEVAQLIEEVDRAADVTAWYREHFLADLVRVCAGIGNLAAAERLVGTANAFTDRHRLSLATARAVLHEAKGESGPAIGDVSRGRGRLDLVRPRARGRPGSVGGRALPRREGCCGGRSPLGASAGRRSATSAPSVPCGSGGSVAIDREAGLTSTSGRARSRSDRSRMSRGQAVRPLTRGLTP